MDSVPTEDAVLEDTPSPIPADVDVDDADDDAIESIKCPNSECNQ